MYAQSAQSFILTKKLVAVKAPIVAAKVKLAKDVKVKVAAVAKKVLNTFLNPLSISHSDGSL